MLHIIADYSESYRTTSFSYSEVKGEIIKRYRR